ncbi:MAG: PEP-CTERM sorting domain-containing protein [Rhodocyclaceae bacterium]|nr:PEP-CTERM sorting domain-containing protein [Rhodocyclaceae bacterium]
MRNKSLVATKVALAVAAAIASISASADVAVNSLLATGSYKLDGGSVTNLVSTGSPSVDVLDFSYAATGSNTGLHSYGSDTGNFGSRSSGYGVYDVHGLFRIEQTITNTTGTAQRANFNFYITPGFINNELGSAMTGTDYVSAGLTFDIRRNGSTVWGSAATLTSNAGGTNMSTSGDASLYAGSGTYYSVAGTQRSVDLGVINAGQSITLSYEMTSFASGQSTPGAPTWVPETTYHVPGQWVDPCWGECSYGDGYEAGEPHFEPAHDVVVPGHWLPGTISGSHASSGDPFEINWNDGTAYFTNQPFSRNFEASVTFTAAVPEPSEYALMLAGLGLMAGIARRRRQKTAS